MNTTYTKDSSTAEQTQVIYEDFDYEAFEAKGKRHRRTLVILMVVSFCIPIIGLAFIVGLAFAYHASKKRKPVLVIRSLSSPLYRGGSTFGDWNEKVHHGAAQSDRFEKALHEPLGLVGYNVNNDTAIVSGSTGDRYQVSLGHCGCPDFDKRSKPCKHIYFLATKMGYTSDDFYSC